MLLLLAGNALIHFLTRFLISDNSFSFVGFHAVRNVLSTFPTLSYSNPRPGIALTHGKIPFLRAGAYMKKKNKLVNMNVNTIKRLFLFFLTC
ncbi:hypothetical protein EIG11_20550 [Escherichia coli]|nr:hypothetical protein [Escherichia coli]